MMTTWRDYLLNKAFTHTWMVYIPGLPLDLDYPEVLGLRVPLPTLVLNDDEDGLFTLAEMHRADAMLAEVYRKANAAETLPRLVLSRPAQVRPADAGGGVCLVRPLVEGMIRPDDVARFFSPDYADGAGAVPRPGRRAGFRLESHPIGRDGAGGRGADDRRRPGGRRAARASW